MSDFVAGTHAIAKGHMPVMGWLGGVKLTDDGAFAVLRLWRSRLR